MAVLTVNIDKPPIPTGKTLWVDAVNGDDATGTPGRQDLPYLTLTAAKADASSGDLIHVRPGSYSVSATLCKNGVNWHGDPGAVITMANGTGTGIFDDDGNQVVSVVTGSFDLVTTDDFSGFTRTYGTVCTRNANSSIRVECNSISGQCPDDNPALNACAWGFDGELYVRCSSMVGTYANCLYWENGEMFIDCPFMSCTGTPTIATLTDLPPTGKMWVNGMQIVSDTSETIFLTGANADAQVWIQALEIRGDGETSSAINAGSAGKNYINAQKLTGGNTGAAVFSTQGTSWIVAEKISGGGASVDSGIVTVNGGKLFLETQHVDPLAADRGIVVTGGSLVMTGGQMAIEGNGLDIRGGTARLSGVSIDTSASSTSSPIVKSGGTLYVNACSLLAEATQDSITAPTSQSVIASGANTIYQPVNANVIVIGNMQEDTGVASAGEVPIAKADGTWEWGAMPDASETVKGIIEIATAAEVAALTDATRAVTPANLKSGALIDVTPSFMNYTGGNQATTNTALADVDSSAGWDSIQPGLYEFQIFIFYNANATSTGARFALNGTLSFDYLVYDVGYAVLGTDRSSWQGNAFDQGQGATSSAVTTGNPGMIEGKINVTSAGNLRLRFATETITTTTITVTAVQGYLRRIA